MTRADKILIIFILLVSVAMIVGQLYVYSAAGPDMVYIYKEAKLLYRFPLSSTKTIRIAQQEGEGYNVIEISNGKVRVMDADCPDKICMVSGYIKRPGQQIVCLPHRLIIKIDGSSTENLDGVAR